ncbi:hypothetical protein [Phormidium sp. FACHB-1136]|uniref:hypothetical protein n=1 Tax=Phormidium sp. FACHB-1136 TaxID=2692848 RepID=UPI00168985E3|nr:hypothetical protein [Phormidium sp. FACHB-1136]MBD2429376.1 hypothetical protein [Phormidium sp. FACHB-1136]
MSQTINDLRDRYLKAIPGGCSPSLEEIRNQYIKVWGDDHCNPDEDLDYCADKFSSAELVVIGKVFLDLAEWKLSYGSETPGVTRVTPVVAVDSAA